MYRVDLNSDLGESFGNYTLAANDEVLKHVSSANVACGLHAGDPVVMRHTVALAKQYGQILPFLEQRRLDKWTHNKAIQKAVESCRITEEQKAYLRTLKIK